LKFRDLQKANGVKKMVTAKKGYAFYTLRAWATN